MAGPLDEMGSVYLRGVADKIPGLPAWSALQPGAKVALVPDPAERAAIETLLADRAGLPGATKAAAQAAKDVHEANLAQFDAETAAAKAAHQQNVASGRAAIDEAKATHKANLNQFDVDTATAKAAHDDVVASAKARISEAEEAHRQVLVREAKPKPSDTAGLLHGIEAGVGGELGEHLGGLAGNVLGVVGIPPHVTALAGMALPTVWRAIRGTGLPNPMAAARGANVGAAAAQANGLAGQ
jgi:hypothetical protein